MTLKLLSYNILFGNKLKGIARWLKKTEAKNGSFDILCFQEFPHEKINQFFNGREKNGLHFQFTPVIYRKKQTFGQLTIFNKKKLNLVKTIHLSLGSSRIESKVFQLFKSAAERKSLLTLFQTHDHQPLLVANTHLTCVSSNGHRRGQLTKILKEVDLVASALVLGDFNYTSFLPRYRLRRLMEKHWLEDVTRRLKTHRLFFIKHQLDYIFTKGVLTTSVTTEEVPFSDHYPLMADLEVAS